MVDDIRSPKLPGSPNGDKSQDEPDEVSFQPPEKIAQEEEVIDMASVDTQAEKPKLENDKSKIKGPKKPGRIKLWLGDVKFWWGKRSKKQKIAIATGAAIGLILAGVGIFFVITNAGSNQKAAPVTQKKEEVKVPPKPTTEASRLTGLQVPPEYNQLPVTGVMIENSPDARPQSGLVDAGVVFEAIAEGGITRFLTLFQEAQPDYVGPVRSVRPYYLQWSQGFDAAIAHVGGSGEALAKIRNEGIKDLDQSFNGGSYERVSGRYAPHNVYTSLGSLIALGKSKGFNTSTFTGFPRKVDKPAATPTAKNVDIVISAPLYNVHYTYDVATNGYIRSMAGALHKDERTGKQIISKVVIAMVLPQGINADGIHTTYQTIGSGTAYIFQDGIATQGTWSKASDKEQILFGDANGAPIGLNAGQTWVVATGSPTNVTFTP